MTNACPCCQRQVKVQPIRPACEYCGYEFRPVPLADQPRPPRRTLSAVLFTFAGTAILLGVGHVPEFVHWLDTRGVRFAPAAASPLSTIHPISWTTPGNRKGLIWGTVFDLKTLRPVPRATLVFEDRAHGKYLGAYANEEGLYQAWLPATEEGFYLTIHHPGYAKAFTEDWVPSLRSQQASTREDLARDLRIRSPDEVHLIPRSSRHFSKDFGLAPISD